jgi:hypothetical protein
LVIKNNPFGKIMEPHGNQQLTREPNKKMISFISVAAMHNTDFRAESCVSVRQ